MRIVTELATTYMTMSGDWRLNDVFNEYSVYALARWLLLLNSSCNMVIYAWIDKKFRGVLARFFCRRKHAAGSSAVSRQFEGEKKTFWKWRKYSRILI